MIETIISILLTASLILIIWAIHKGRKIACMLRFLLVAGFLMFPAISQEELPPLENPPLIDDIGDPHPLVVPPDYLTKAENAIIGTVGDFLGSPTDHEMFLSDFYWPCNYLENNNSSRFINITA